jgi:hypothetical protein
MMHEFLRFDSRFASRAGEAVLEIGSVPLPVATSSFCNDRLRGTGAKFSIYRFNDATF